MRYSLLFTLLGLSGFMQTLCQPAPAQSNWVVRYYTISPLETIFIGLANYWFVRRLGIVLKIPNELVVGGWICPERLGREFWHNRGNGTFHLPAPQPLTPT